MTGTGPDQARSFRVVDTAIAARRPQGTPASNPSPAPTGLTTKNVPGETGFSALGGVQQASGPRRCCAPG